MATTTGSKGTGSKGTGTTKPRTSTARKSTASKTARAATDSGSKRSSRPRSTATKTSRQALRARAWAPSWLARPLDAAAATAASLRGQDVLLYSAALTTYALISAVPIMLVGLALAGVALGEDTVRDLSKELAGRAPEDVGVQRALTALAERGPQVGLLTVVVAAAAASRYGAGLSRALERLDGEHRAAKALVGRLKGVALVTVAPLVVGVCLGSSLLLGNLLGDGAVGIVLGVWAAFVVAWGICSLLVAAVYRLFGRGDLSARAMAWSSSATGSMVAGTTLGYLGMLAAGIDPTRPYAGSQALGQLLLATLWLLLVNLYLLVGYALALVLDGKAINEGQGRATATEC